MFRKYNRIVAKTQLILNSNCLKFSCRENQTKINFVVRGAMNRMAVRKMRGDVMKQEFKGPDFRHT